jgi:hypothetical protein
MKKDVVNSGKETVSRRWMEETRVSIESMEEKTAYIHGGQGARQGC